MYSIIILFDTARFGRIFEEEKKIVLSNNSPYFKGICICVEGKEENKYVREFVEYYENLGVDKIVIFDNNDENGERFEDVLKDFINNKFVEIIDIRGFSSSNV